MSVKSDIEIARAATMLPIQEIGAKLDIPPEALIPYGHDKAKVSQSFIEGVQSRPNGKLILVTAINPTPAGEGKTTTTVGLGDGLNRIGKNTAVCIREASLGPNFGMKGGAAGGGYAQVVPMEDINLHFTGDIHAVSAAHNLLSALLDNSIHFDNPLRIDERDMMYPRAMDMNDRVLRTMVVGLGGRSNGPARCARPEHRRGGDHHRRQAHQDLGFEPPAARHGHLRVTACRSRRRRSRASRGGTGRSGRRCRAALPPSS